MATRAGLIDQLTRQGQSQKAIDLLRLELVEHPDDAQLHALLAVNLMREKRMYAAEHEALLALKMQPDLPMAHLVYGHVLLARQRVEPALDSFREALALAPRSSEAHLGVGRCQERLGDEVAARASYYEARRLDPTSSDPHFRLAAMALERRDMEEAEREAKEALALELEDADNLVLMGMVRYRQWQLEEARDLCLQALRVNPVHPEALRLLCWLKARSTPLLAPWWWLSGAVGRLDQQGRIRTQVYMFLAYRLVVNVLVDLGLTRAAGYVGFVWLAFCIYTWISPYYFAWMVAREKRQVELKDEF